ncbi:MAG: amino acid ABC transporter substrate-binding protein [Spirochaetaceae bacterium]|jgi:cystine transport system substrate-binding protein|nr:amino acid ABC transporter substrate-binding protein [Spirochaetaceae bacterium]
MKKLIVVGLVFTLAAVSAFASAKKESSVNSLERVKTAGELAIGIEGTYPPYTYHDAASNKLAGYDVEVAEAIAAKLGVKPRFIESKWDSLVIGLDSGLWDVVINQVGITAARKEKYDFSVPYTYTHGVVIVRNNNDSIKSFDDLNGKSSAQTITSNWAQLAERYGAKIIGTDGFNESVQLVIDRRADATINDDVTFADYLKEHPETPTKIVATSTDVTESAVILAKNQKELREAIDKALAELSADGTLTRLSLKYLNLDVSKR